MKRDSVITTPIAGSVKFSKAAFWTEYPPGQPVTRQRSIAATAPCFQIFLITAAMAYDRSTREIQSALVDRHSKHLGAICANNIEFTIGTSTNESFVGWLNP
jgi:hypothetical protein